MDKPPQGPAQRPLLGLARRAVSLAQLRVVASTAAPQTKDPTKSTQKGRIRAGVIAVDAGIPRTCVGRTVSVSLDAPLRKRESCSRLARRKKAPPRVGPPLVPLHLQVAPIRASNTCVFSGRGRGNLSLIRSKETVAACDDFFLSYLGQMLLYLASSRATEIIPGILLVCVVWSCCDATRSGCVTTIVILQRPQVLILRVCLSRRYVGTKTFGPCHFVNTLMCLSQRFLCFYLLFKVVCVITAYYLYIRTHTHFIKLMEFSSCIYFVPHCHVAVQPYSCHVGAIRWNLAYWTLFAISILLPSG